MKIGITIIIVFLAGISGGFFLAGEGFLAINTSDDIRPTERKVLYWVAPMDKNYRRDGPGQSPMGMDLEPVYEDEASADDSTVSISPTVENNLGVKVSKVTKEALILPIETVGTVQYDESRISHIHSRVEGWIEQLGVAATGDKVSKGQVLFSLYSPALVSAQEEYLAAKRSGNKRLIRASSSRLLALGLTPDQVSALGRRGKVENTINIVAQHDGIVVQLNVRKGMHIKPSTDVLALGTLDSVWLRAEIFERQAYQVQQGQSVRISVPSYPDQTWSGSINYIYPELNPLTRTLQVRVRVVNTAHMLKPNMFANLTIENAGLEKTLTIPRSALIKTASHHRVVKSLGDGKYQSVLVETGHEGKRASKGTQNVSDESRVQVYGGLNEGDWVVTSAQFLIDSESNIDAALDRLDTSTNASEVSSDVAKNTVLTSGIIEQVMPAMGMVKIRHEPIPEWDWPVMTMDFPIADSLALSDFKAGETIAFKIVKTGDWDFEISGLVARDTNRDTKHGATESLDDAMHHDIQHHSNNGATQ